jgi:hypothetical protein
MSNVSRHVTRRFILIGCLTTILVGVVALLTPRARVLLSPDAVVPIVDASCSSEVLIRPLQPERAAFELLVLVSGRLDGEAEIALVDREGTILRTERIGGNVLAWIGSDWYSPDAVLRYLPRAGTRGTLSVRYRFGTL